MHLLLPLFLSTEATRIKQGVTVEVKPGSRPRLVAPKPFSMGKNAAATDRPVDNRDNDAKEAANTRAPHVTKNKPMHSGTMKQASDLFALQNSKNCAGSYLWFD